MLRTTTSSLPMTLWALTTQLTDFSHFSSSTTLRFNGTSASSGLRSTITSTWNALLREGNRERETEKGKESQPGESHKSFRRPKILSIYMPSLCLANWLRNWKYSQKEEDVCNRPDHIAAVWWNTCISGLFMHIQSNHTTGRVRRLSGRLEIGCIPNGE